MTWMVLVLVMKKVARNSHLLQVVEMHLLVLCLAHMVVAGGV